MHSPAKVLILKLCRVIMSHGERYVEKLRCYGIEEALKNCIYLQENSITVSSGAGLIDLHIGSVNIN